MDRRYRRNSCSGSRSPPRHRSPGRGRRRRSRSYSPSPSHSVAGHPLQASEGSKGWTRDRNERKRSVSYDRHQQRETTKRAKWINREHDHHHKSRRSTSRSMEKRMTNRSRDFNHRDSSHRRSPSPRRRSPPNRRHLMQSRSPTPRRRSPTPRRRSPTPKRRCTSSEKRRNFIPHHRSPSRQRRSSSIHHRSASSQGYSGSPHHHSPHRQTIRHRSPSPRRHSQQHKRNSSHRSTSGCRRRHSPCRDQRSRSRSNSRRYQIQDAASRSNSPRRRSNSRKMDSQFTDNPTDRQSTIALSSSAARTPVKEKSADFSNGKECRKESIKRDSKIDEHRSSTAGNDDQRGGNMHGDSCGTNHQKVHNRCPVQQGACATSSSTAVQGPSAPVKTATVSDRAKTSFPRGDHSSASTPTRSTDVSGNHHTFSPVVNPVVEKKRQAQRESHRAYLKSNSDYNRAEMKYVSIEAELRLAEFWLDIMTKNLEDVGKRIEVHDWNFQKITNQDESNVA